MSKINLSNIRKSKDAIKNKGHWSQGLLTAMNDPNFIVEQDSETVVIKDKFPKAKHHFLILSKQNITGISSLNKTHLKLLRHMECVANDLIKKYESNFKIGYHSVPSMQRLHMHVISDDFVSPCLKTKIHWNSYTTSFFISSTDLIAMIEEKGLVIKISSESHKNLMNTPLKCHKCNFTPKNMPNLKEHLLTHVN